MIHIAAQRLHIQCGLSIVVPPLRGSIPTSPPKTVGSRPRLRHSAASRLGLHRHLPNESSDPPPHRAASRRGTPSPPCLERLAAHGVSRGAAPSLSRGRQPTDAEYRKPVEPRSGGGTLRCRRHNVQNVPPLRGFRFSSRDASVGSRPRLSHSAALRLR
jgi:hypothetical protein